MAKNFEEWWAETWGQGGPHGMNVHLKGAFERCWLAAVEAEKERERECQRKMEEYHASFTTD